MNQKNDDIKETIFLQSVNLENITNNPTNKPTNKINQQINQQMNQKK